MENTIWRKGANTRSLLRGTSVLVGLVTVFAAAAPSFAQDATEVVTVTGYRASLESAVNAKKDVANFSDSVFAEDIGKFPDMNMAEAINRVPGIRLNRDANGEGTQIYVRGLGPSFTEVTMNGHPIEVATDGVEGSGNSNREVDLDNFPVELFTRITVAKTPTAQAYEGGISGSVDMATVRPMDNPEAGFHLVYSLQDQYNNAGGTFSPRGAVIASYNWDDKLAVLVGVQGQHLKYRVDGYEDVGNAIAGMTDQLGTSVCPTSACNTIGTGKNFHWATVVPAGLTASELATAGLTGYSAGQAYNYAGTLSTAGGTSGLSLAGLSNVIFPYLARESTKYGDRNRMSGLLDLQYRPTENLEFNVSALLEGAQRDYTTNEMDWYVRNSCNTAGTAASCMIPVNVQADSMGYLTSGTFLNTAWFFDPVVYRENVRFFDINPTVDWTVKPWLKIHGSLDYNDSSLNRTQWSFQFQTTPGSGLTTTYKMNPGQDFPTITTNAPFTNPNSPIWEWYRIQVQPLYRNTVGKATKWEAVIGDETANLTVGYDYSQYYRQIHARDYGTDAGNCIIGPSTATNCTLPNGTVAPAGTQLIPQSALDQYLIMQPTGSFLGLSDGSQGFGNYLSNSLALATATNIRGFDAAAPFSASGALGAQKSGFVDESTQNAYIEANANVKFLEHDIHFNAGLRYYNTDQKITGPVLVNGAYTNVSLEHTYQGTLPSFNVAANLTADVILRFAGSKSMTRPVPSAMLPGVSFGSALLSPISAGNPNLQPYYSDNMDLGLEWYTGGPGIVAIDYFRKEISNFTQAQQIQEPFSQTGIPLSVLSPTQLVDYNANGGQNEIVTVNTTVNIGQKVYLEGWEFQWVQPLDYFIEGAGLTANYTRVTESISKGTIASVLGLVTGVPPYAFNLGAYYENDVISVHVNYNYIDGFISAAAPSQQGIQYPQYTNAYGQLDFSSSYTLPWLKGTVMEGAQLTFDATNLTSEKQRAYDGDTNSPNFVWYPGRAFMLGLRGKF